MAETLQTLLNATRRLLHDASAQYWSDGDLTIAINTACKRAVSDSTCYRAIQTIHLSPGRENYVYGGLTGAAVKAGGAGYTSASTITFSAPPAGGQIATGTLLLAGDAVSALVVDNPGRGYLTAPTYTLAGPGAGAALSPTILSPSTLDVMNLTVVWGQTRVILNRMSFTEFQASVRGWVGYQQRPGICASYGQDQWFIGPVPDQYFLSEWDTVLVPPELVNLTDVSVVGYPYSDTVPFYAAHIAKLNEQSYDESERFLNLYTQKMRYAQKAAMMRMLRSAYGS